jgi:16S rRNA G966 N2-methylase RsmD
MPLTSWSIPPSEVIHILNDIIMHSRKSVIEFGSGFSTLCIAQLIKTNGLNCVFYSIESNREWLGTMQAMLEKYKLTDFVKMVLAEVEVVEDTYAKQKNSKWYSIRSLTNGLTSDVVFDLVIVDGPFGSISPYARYPAIPFLKEKHLAKNFAIFLDDTSRPHELQITEDWSKMLLAEARIFNRYAYISVQKGFDTEPFAFRKS